MPMTNIFAGIKADRVELDRLSYQLQHQAPPTAASSCSSDSGTESSSATPPPWGQRETSEDLVRECMTNVCDPLAESDGCDTLDVRNNEHEDLPWSSYVFQVWNLIIRPPRSRYSRCVLNARFPADRFKVGRWWVRKVNFKLMNDRGIQLVCTIFEPDSTEGGPASTAAQDVGAPSGDERACVVFCHGHGSNRMQGFELVPLLLPLDISLVCFDFAGSGMSGGEFSSLGYFERDDLSCVIQHLRTGRGFTRVGVWGVSMGAATALMQATRDPSIAGVVADSPFSDLNTLIGEICKKWVPVPPWILDSVLTLLRKVVRRKAGFDIEEVSPLAHIDKCFVPLYFMHGDKDDFIIPEHSKKLRQECHSEAGLLNISGGTHNSRRPLEHKARATLFLVRAMRWEKRLPRGVTEQNIVELAGRAGAAATPPAAACRAGADRAVRSLLDSSSPSNVQLGIIKAACLLSAPHTGAEVIPVIRCGLDTSEEVTPICLWRPGSVAGTLRLGADSAEAALSWVEGDFPPQGPGASTSVKVWFALASSLTLSLTSVTLRTGVPPLGKAQVGGFTLDLVETADLRNVALRSGSPHSLRLTLAADGAVQFDVAGSPVGSAASYPRSTGTPSRVWALRWCGGAHLQLCAEQ